MGATAGAIAEGLGHEGGNQAVAVGNLLRHQLEEGETIGHRQHFGVVEIGFKLAGPILVVEGIHPPTQAIHGLHQFIEPGQVIEQAAHVIGGLIKAVALAVGH